MSDHSKAEARAWIAFSRMIRARDEIDGYFRCPTCGRTLAIDQADAGHYISRVRKATMFDEKNVHAQCRHCNRFQEGNHFIYRAWLVGKYGAEQVAALELRARVGGGYSTADLLLMAKEYRARAKAIKERKDKGCKERAFNIFEEDSDEEQADGFAEPSICDDRKAQQRRFNRRRAG